ERRAPLRATRWREGVRVPYANDDPGPRVRAMKAAVYYKNGPPEVLQYEDVADPVCGPGFVLVKVEAISIEGGDTLNRLGGELLSTPHIVGYQCAGTIVEVG